MPETIDAPMQTQEQDPSEEAPARDSSPVVCDPGHDVMPAQAGTRGTGHGPSVREVQFAEAPPECHPCEGGGEAAGGGQFDILLDMSVPVSVVLGQTQIPIRRLLQLGPGSVLQLEKPVQTPADLYLKDAKFAEVDVVIVEDRFAVRIRKIVGAN
jgi:flagellar motor switch protein FliN